MAKEKVFLSRKCCKSGSYWSPWQVKFVPRCLLLENPDVDKIYSVTVNLRWAVNLSMGPQLGSF